MTAEGQEIAADGLHVQGQVPGALRRVDHRHHPVPAGAGAQVGDRVDHGHGVGDVGQGEQPDAVGEQRINMFKVERAFVPGDRDVNQPCPRAFGHHLPRDEVAVVLEFAEEDGVAGLEVIEGPGLGDEVDAFGGAAGENDFLRVTGVEESGGPFASGLVGAGGPVAQRVDAAMDVGVVALVVVEQGVQDGTRFLAGRGVVKIDQRMAVDFLIQDREVPANL